MNPLAIAVAAAICLPAFVMAARRSPWLIDYIIVLVALNRGIRRVVDYYSGGFDRYSAVALTPLVVGGLMAYLTLTQTGYFRKLGARGRRVLSLYAIALGMAFAVGIVRNGIGAVLELGEYTVQFGMLGFGVIHGGADPKLLARWARSLAIAGVAVAAYGLYQFYTIPPWDAAWVRAVGFEGYLGDLVPTKMTLFSTMAERGPAATFLASSLVVMLLRPKLLGSLKWPLVALTGYAMLLTYVRTALLQLVAAALLAPIAARGRGVARTLGIGVAMLVACQVLVATSPKAEKILNRFSTLGALGRDASATARVPLFLEGVRVVATNPLGLGLGSQGSAKRVANKNSQAVGDSTGYLKILQGFGWIGGACVFRILWIGWNSSGYVLKRSPDDPDAYLYRAWLLSGLFALIVGNWLAGTYYFWALTGAMVARHDQWANARQWA